MRLILVDNMKPILKIRQMKPIMISTEVFWVEWHGFYKVVQTSHPLWVVYKEKVMRRVANMSAG